MKYLAILALLLTGCNNPLTPTHKAQISDCFLFEDAFYVVLEVGKYSIECRKVFEDSKVIFATTELPGAQVDCYSYGNPTKKEK